MARDWSTTSRLEPERGLILEKRLSEHDIDRAHVLQPVNSLREALGIDIVQAGKVDKAAAALKHRGRHKDVDALGSYAV
eukprot:scaffold23147_cov147-Isochrysis_galbana.AAC.4